MKRKTKMKIKKRISRIIIFSLILIVSSFVASIFNEPGSFNVLETSVLNTLKNIAEENAPAPPDLSIEDISVKKIENPNQGSNYYKYKANITIKNYGGNIRDSQVILRCGDNQRYTLIKNTEEGFSLRGQKTYIIRNYEFVLEGKYNGGNIPFYIDIVDEYDTDKSNNSFIVELFELPPKIDSISIEEILKDGSFVIYFDTAPYSSKEHEFEIFESESINLKDEILRYDEIFSLEKIYGYYRIKNSLNNLKKNFTSKKVSELESHFITFSEDPYKDEDIHFAYIKITNKSNGHYAFSNILMFVPQEEIDRAQFAKLFVDYTESKIYDLGAIYFEDVKEDEWYAPYVQTIYNLGLLNTETVTYSPEKIMTRGEVLRVVMDFYDVDLVIPEGSPHFIDVPEDDGLFPYAESLVADAKGFIFRDYLYPDEPATKNYLKYLIYEYRKGY